MNRLALLVVSISFAVLAVFASSSAAATDVTPVLEIRTYELKPGTVAEFDRLVCDVMPMLARWGTDVVTFGPSRDGEDTYLLIRAYRSLEALSAEQEAFYGSDEWKQGPREAILALIDQYTSVVLEVDASGITAFRQAVRGTRCRPGS